MINLRNCLAVFLCPGRRTAVIETDWLSSFIRYVKAGILSVSVDYVQRLLLCACVGVAERPQEIL